MKREKANPIRPFDAKWDGRFSSRSTAADLLVPISNGWIVWSDLGWELTDAGRRARRGI